MREIGGQLGEWSNVPRIRENFAWRSFNVLLLSGLWRQAIDMLKDASGRAGHGLHSGSAATDLAVGLAYVYAGRGYMALDPLLAAIAQLEVRASLQSLRQAYAATAFAYAQTGNSVQATMYLDRARSADGPARFTVGTSTQFCMDMASRWLGDPEAKDRLVRSAEEHFRKGRHTLAGICMFGATVNGTVKDFLFMEEIAGLRQGPLAEMSRTVGVGTRKKDAAIMLEAAEQAAAWNWTPSRPGARARVRLRQERRTDRRRQRRVHHAREPLGVRPGAAHHAPQQGPAAHGKGAANRHPCRERGLQQGHRPGSGHFRQNSGGPPVPGVHEARRFFAK